MEKKLIVKAKVSTENKNKIQCANNYNRWEIGSTASFSDIVACAFSRLGEHDIFYDLVLDSGNKYNSIKELIKQGFTIRIDETEMGYGLIVLKGKCSISFSVSKECGIAKLLAEANDYAETMIEDLKAGNIL